MNGLTYKLKPVKNTTPDGGMDFDLMSANILAENVNPVKTPQPGYLYRNLNRSDVYYDENVQRMVQNYRFNYMKLAQYSMSTRNDREKAKEIFTIMEKTIPINIIPMQDWRISSYFMTIFNQLGDTAHFNLYAKSVEASALDALNNNRIDAQDPFMPYRTLLDIYDARKDYNAAIDLLGRAQAQYPNVQEIKSRIQFYEQQLKGSAARPDSGKPN